MLVRRNPENFPFIAVPSYLVPDVPGSNRSSSGPSPLSRRLTAGPFDRGRSFSRSATFGHRGGCEHARSGRFDRVDAGFSQDCKLAQSHVPWNSRWSLGPLDLFHLARTRHHPVFAVASRACDPLFLFFFFGPSEMVLLTSFSRSIRDRTHQEI